MQNSKQRLRLILVLLIFSCVALAMGYRYWYVPRHTHPPKVYKVTPRTPFTYQVLTADSSAKGYILLAPYKLSTWKYGLLLMMDMQGRIVYQKEVTGSVSDFRQWHIDGHTRYSYFVDDAQAHHIKKISVAAGHIIILDSAMHEIKQLHLLPHDAVSVTEHQDLDPHDLILLSDDHYYQVAYYERQVSNIPDSLHPAPHVHVVVPIIQEVQNNKVVWQWDATNYPEFYGNSTDRNHFSDTTMAQDYIHLNSMTIDPHDSDLILAFRNQNQIIKIDRHTGNIIWRLGGKNSDYHLSEEQQFQRQHQATLVDNNTLLVFDNGDSTINHRSRILEFKLNEKQRKVTSFHAYAIPQKQSHIMGSVQKLGSDYFIGGGSANYILQINPKTNKKKLEILTNLTSYRVYQVSSIDGVGK